MTSHSRVKSRNYKEDQSDGAVKCQANDGVAADRAVKPERRPASRDARANKRRAMLAIPVRRPRQAHAEFAAGSFDPHEPAEQSIRSRARGGAGHRCGQRHRTSHSASSGRRGGVQLNPRRNEPEESSGDAKVSERTSSASFMWHEETCGRCGGKRKMERPP